MTAITGLGFPSPSPPFSCRSVIIIISIGRLGRLGCGRLLSNFFPSDYKGCVNKPSAIDSHQSMHRLRGSPSQFPAAAASFAAGEIRPGSAENKLNQCQLFLFLPSLLMDGMGLVYQEEEKLIDTGFNVIMPGLSGHISSFLILFYFFLFFERHFIAVYRTSCQNYWYKQESRCINNSIYAPF